MESLASDSLLPLAGWHGACAPNCGLRYRSKATGLSHQTGWTGVIHLATTLRCSSPRGTGLALPLATLPAIFPSRTPHVNKRPGLGRFPTQLFAHAQRPDADHRPLEASIPLPRLIQYSHPRDRQLAARHAVPRHTKSLVIVVILLFDESIISRSAGQCRMQIVIGWSMPGTGLNNVIQWRRNDLAAVSKTGPRRPALSPDARIVPGPSTADTGSFKRRGRIDYRRTQSAGQLHPGPDRSPHQGGGPTLFGRGY